MIVRNNVSYKYYHCTDHKAKFVQIPYKGNISMYILLPEERDGLQQLVEGWKKDELKDMITHMNHTLMNLMLPKFEFDYEIDILKTFEKMGVDIRPVWSSTHPTLYVSVHCTAAAVTVLLFETFSLQRPVYPMELKADRPFVFVIRDDISNVNLFVGTVNKLIFLGETSGALRRTGLQLNEKNFANGINSFALEFAKKLNYTTTNVFCSPLRLAMTTGMLLKGAQGKLSEDLYKMLHMSQYENKEKIHHMFPNLMTEYKGMATTKNNPRNVLLEIIDLILRDEQFTLPEELVNVLK
ncbi:uncharacterized protein B4U80_12280, partial [Leptotrombidium deliense]